jgi:septum formation protein
MAEPKSKYILASASPRRAEILRAIGLDFEVVPSAFEEPSVDGEIPSEYVVRVARGKVAEVAARVAGGVVIGADTIVVVDGRSLGKPTGAQDARAMLRLLSGRLHAVMTGVVVRDAASGREHGDYEKTLVRFADLADQDIDAYVATGEPLDKAGAYGIQGRGMLFVEEIAGNYHNVMGLPANLLARLVKRLGLTV